MASDTNKGSQWDHVAAELRACREAQQRAWGDIDNTTLGRYLAGEVSIEEQRYVENALDELPELRKLTELVRDVLGESEVVVPAPVSSTPTILPFARPAAPRQEGRPWLRDARFRQRAGLVAAAGLLLVLSFTLPRSGGTSPQAETSLAMSPPVATHIVAFEPEGHFLGAGAGIDGKHAPAPRLMMAAANHGGQMGEKRELLDRLDASVRTLEAQGKKREAKALARQYARNLTRQALVYQEKGDWCRAEPALNQARILCEGTLGPQAPETVRTRRSLAGVYEIALNTMPSSPSLDAAPMRSNPSPALLREKQIEKAGTTTAPPEQPRGKPMHHRHHAARLQQPTAVALRERITCQSQRELRASVVPVLIQALRKTSDAGERERLARALGQLGPAARDAVPLLIDCYHQTTDPSERAALLAVFGEIGPAARLALPLVAEVVQKPDEHPPIVYVNAVRALRQIGPAVHRRDRNASLSPQVVRYIDSPAGRSGIVDEAECFRISTIRQGQDKIRRLANTHRIEIVIETAPGPTAAALADKVDDQEDVPAVHLRIDKDVPRVRVHVSESLRKQGLTDAELQRAIEPHLRKKDFDRALQTSVEFLAAFEGNQGKK